MLNLVVKKLKRHPLAKVKFPDEEKLNMLSLFINESQLLDSWMVCP